MEPAKVGTDGAVVDAVIQWYDSARRDLPWREPGCSPWGVLVSEVMLQQTPVARVLPVWRTWMARWPTPPALAAEAPGDAVAAWGRLGYPRRALRLHGAATACVDRHEGRVPETYEELRALPGVGDYTAAAVAAFAFGRRQVVLDTNVRRVLARFGAGAAYEPPGAPSAAERRRAEALLPADPEGASAQWNVGAHGARRPRLHGAKPAVRRVPCLGRLLVAAGRVTALGRARPARSDLRRHRPAGAGSAARGAPGRRGTRCGHHARRRLGGPGPTGSRPGRAGRRRAGRTRRPGQLQAARPRVVTYSGDPAVSIGGRSGTVDFGS